MGFEFRLPDLGEGVVEGEVVKWHVSAGDNVREDQPMVEVMTDKATVEIPSPKAGRVAEILAPAGKICAVGQVMVVIEESGAASSKSAPSVETRPASAPTVHAATMVATTSGGSEKVLATPATRKLARDMGVDLSTVRATGDNGRITAEDVRGAKNGHAATAAASLRPAPSIPQVGDVRIPFRGLRKKIAENMHRSKSTAAHFTYVEECDATALMQLRKHSKARAEDRGVKLSFLPFIVKAVCDGLKKFPAINATLDEAAQEIIQRKRYHIGVATAAPDGLIVPVVKDADQKSIYDLARSIDEISERTRTGKATRDELTGSTFTISSLGTLGGVLATPIINFPEVAILGVHKIRQTPVVRDGQIVVRDMMYLSISLDHRVVDGYEGAQFLAHVIALLEQPTLMFLDSV